jgi:HSP20 family protein
MMDRLFEDAFVMPRDGNGSTNEAGSAALNVYEDGDNLVIEALMPGIRPDNVDITVEGGTLTIRGTTEQDDERTDRNYLIREHRRMSFVRSMRLPDTVDAERIQASFENGVLRLTVPRAEQAKPRRISVNGNGTRQMSSGESRNQSSGESRNPSVASSQSSSTTDANEKREAQPSESSNAGMSQTPDSQPAGQRS